jgi:transcriptional regulator with XRE-family HTH domain
MPDEDVLEEVAERLVRFRTRRGLTVEDAALHTGIDGERLADVEAGTVALNEAELARVCATYGVDLSEVFGGRVTPIQDYAGGA